MMSASLHDHLQQILSEAQVTERGRELGADFARLGMHVPEDSPTSVHEGFAAAAYSGFRPKALDRFQRKWLQLRMGALRRQRLVSPLVTPDFLRTIDASWCPVLRIALTHGERADTDWSVDRLNNGGAYAPGNIVVMSTRANSAKGSLSYAEVRARSKAVNPTEGLQPAEWLRMACVMYGACHVDVKGLREWLPLATVIPTQSTWPMEFALQDSFLKASATSRHRNQLARDLRRYGASEDHHQILVRVLERLHYAAKGLQYRHDALLDDRIQRDIQAWHDRVPRSYQDALRRAITEIHGGERLSPERREAWSMQTRGYLA